MTEKEQVIPALQQPDDQACQDMWVLLYFSSLSIDIAGRLFQHSHSYELHKPSMTSYHSKKTTM